MQLPKTRVTIIDFRKVGQKGLKNEDKLQIYFKKRSKKICLN